MDASTSVTVTAPEVKPGYKTSEFWFSAVAAVVGLLLTSGVIAVGSGADQVVGIFATVLTAMGYSVSRGIAKKTA